MNLNKYTEKAQKPSLRRRQCRRDGHPDHPEHPADAARKRDGIVPSIVRKMNADPNALATAVRTELGRAPRAHGGSGPTLSARLRKVTNEAESEAERLKDDYVSTEHLFVAIAGEGGGSPAGRLLEQQRITRDAILQALTAVRGSQRVTCKPGSHLRVASSATAAI